MNRLPQKTSPAKNTSKPAASPMLISDGTKWPIRYWSANSGDGFWVSWKSDWLVHNPSAALIAIQVGASSQTWLLRRIWR